MPHINYIQHFPQVTFIPLPFFDLLSFTSSFPKSLSVLFFYKINANTTHVHSLGYGHEMHHELNLIENAVSEKLLHTVLYFQVCGNEGQIIRSGIKSGTC